MVPLLQFIVWLIDLYIGIVFISVILSWLIVLDIVNRRNRVVYMIADAFYRMTEPALRPIRRMMPDLGSLDISPLVLLIALYFLRNVVILGWLLPHVI